MLRLVIKWRKANAQNFQIIDSDAFLEMPLSTQALYFHLSMRGQMMMVL